MNTNGERRWILYLEVRTGIRKAFSELLGLVVGPSVEGEGGGLAIAPV